MVGPGGNSIDHSTCQLHICTTERTLSIPSFMESLSQSKTRKGFLTHFLLKFTVLGAFESQTMLSTIGLGDKGSGNM